MMLQTIWWAVFRLKWRATLFSALLKNLVYALFQPLGIQIIFAIQFELIISPAQIAREGAVQQPNRTATAFKQLEIRLWEFNKY